jgi:hypothetical protein
MNNNFKKFRWKRRLNKILENIAIERHVLVCRWGEDTVNDVEFARYYHRLYQEADALAGLIMGKGVDNSEKMLLHDRRKNAILYSARS